MFKRFIAVMVMIANIVTTDKGTIFIERLTARLYRAKLPAWADLVATFPVALKTTIELAAETTAEAGAPSVNPVPEMKLKDPAAETAPPPAGQVGKAVPSHPSQGEAVPLKHRVINPDEPPSHEDLWKPGDPEPDPEKVPTP